MIITSPLKIDIEALQPESDFPVAPVVAEAMLSNPLHVAVFKSTDAKSLERQVKLFEIVLKQPGCNIFVARHNKKVVGVMNYYLPGQCQISKLKTINMLPSLCGILGRRLPAVLSWKSAWSKQDPRSAHLHFGPLAVLPSYQKKGIGSLLLQHFCDIADSQSMDAYLETDRNENVGLYMRFGFSVIQTQMVCGVRNWFMWRKAYRSI